MRFYLLFFILVLNNCNQSNNVIQIETELNYSDLFIGSVLEHKISLKDIDLFQPDSISINWNDNGLWLVDSSSILVQSHAKQFQNEYVLNHKITFWDTGEFTIPPINLKLINESDSLLFQSDSFKVFIESSIDSTMKKIFPLKSPEEINFPLEKVKIFYLILILALIILFFNFLKSEKSKHLFKRNFYNQSPISDAIDSLNNINIESLSTEEFYLEISNILRKFLENNFYLVSFEMTSEDILSIIENNDLKKILSNIDQSKFGKKEFEDDIKKADLELTKKIIRTLFKTVQIN